MIDFFKTMLLLPTYWIAWLLLLIATNMIIPLIYLNTVEGKLVLLAMICGAVTQTAIFSAKGFVRLLGIGHIYWIPLIIWLWTRLDPIPIDSLFGQWLVSVLILNSLSLIVDASDVIRYIRGERVPQLTLNK